MNELQHSFKIEVLNCHYLRMDCNIEQFIQSADHPILDYEAYMITEYWICIPRPLIADDNMVI